MKSFSADLANQTQEGEQRCLNSELWHACAGPLVSLPALGSRAVYFPQGHGEQVTASTNKEIDAHIPNYPSLPAQLICQLHNVTMHADVETDEVYAQMTLQPLSPQEQKDPYLPVELGTPSKQPTNYFCKTLTASDTSTHGGFSVPRRAAEKVFPPLDFTQQPPCQELVARDLHDNEWKFRHIFRGQPKRHLLTTGWSVFVSAKKLVAGDSILFIWNENNQLLVGIRRANRPQTVMPSSVLSSDSMHIGLLAAAAHAAATNSRFTIFYNPRASPSEFVIPLAKYAKAVYHTRISVGMRFRMLFETEESSVRRYMGTITGIGDLDPARWPNSHWRSVKVGWDESTAGDRQPRVSLWEIEPLTIFPMYPSPFPLRLKRPWPSGLPSLHGGDQNMSFFNYQGIGVSPWPRPRLDASVLGLQPDMYQAMAAAALQEMRGLDPPKLAAPTILQFQPDQSVISGSTLLGNQYLQQMHAQSQQMQPQSQFLQSQLQHCHSFSDQQQNQQLHQLEQYQEAEQKQSSSHQVSNIVSALSQLTSASQSQLPSHTVTSFSHQNFPESNGNPVSSSGFSPLHSILGSFSPDGTANHLSLTRTSPLINSTRCNQSQIERLSPSRNGMSPHSVTLPQYSGRECSLDHEDSVDPENRLFFGGNLESLSPLVQNGMTSFRSVGNETDIAAVPCTVADFMSITESELPLSQALLNSSCLEESGFLKSPDNIGQVNPQSGTFVKVYKSGSFGRSLDITKFNSYPELRRELGRLFGLEGQLENPLRSGWQLVFVDRENDVLLLGDDPWQEFVNSVWCIKILSPQEVQQMGDPAVDLMTSGPTERRFSAGSCDEFVGLQGSRNPSSGISSFGSMDY